MRQQELDRYRKVLLALKARIMHTVADMREGALATDQAPADDSPADHGTDAYTQDLALSLAQGGQETIQAIDAALLRIERGTFADCDACHKAIPKKRLTAVPWARLCLACQEEEDSLGGG
jgi:RNA polymerase-binding transcription factor DksA